MSDLSDLFALDPLRLTVEDLDEIIAYYRKARANFILGPKPVAAKTPKAVKEKIGQIDLDELMKGE